MDRQCGLFLRHSGKWHLYLVKSNAGGFHEVILYKQHEGRR